MRLTITDDHQIVRVGLRTILEAEADIQVVGESASAASALATIVAARPDVALLDVSLPDGRGLTVVSDVRRHAPATRVLVLSVHTDWETVQRAIAAGAHGYIAKSAEPAEIVQAVRSVASGRAFLNVPVEPRQTVLSSVPPPPKPSVRPESSAPRSLSERERQVLELYARGYTQRQIADSLGVRAKTIETYRGRLGVKFAARSRAEIVQSARDQGYLQALDDCSLE